MQAYRKPRAFNRNVCIVLFQRNKQKKLAFSKSRAFNCNSILNFYSQTALFSCLSCLNDFQAAAVLTRGGVGVVYKAMLRHEHDTSPLSKQPGLDRATVLASFQRFDVVIHSPDEYVLPQVKMHLRVYSTTDVAKNIRGGFERECVWPGPRVNFLPGRCEGRCRAPSLLRPSRKLLQ